MSGTGDGAPIRLVKRPPYEREQVLAAKRAELVAAGLPLNGFDAVLAELRRQGQMTLAGLAKGAELVVASFCAEYAEQLSLLPAAISQGLIVRATVAYLYGYGVMTPIQEAELGWHPLEWKDAVPEHLRPDVEQAMRGYSRMLAALGEVRPQFGETVPVGTPLYDPPPVERA